ncbi:hypothetical protein [Halobacteriovorax sp. JY17]|uniref:hypothetical protein n=1 Tax=Halobacteriovorax sp. JY17 TaxID=2014617 RepID=UPI000C4442DD|nr:hypothetical protein [Halobacteriovorax sp. JY17]PIK14371.1 MAG: hypothetical protein CES88_08480 [Halobacteriovorax sp. JY17]
MNDLDLKKLLKKDDSVPKAPSSELNQIHQRIASETFDLSTFFNIKSLALACCLVIVISGVKFSINSFSTPVLTEAEQQELIEYMLEDAYLNNGESSYAWVEVDN